MKEELVEHCDSSNGRVHVWFTVDRLTPQSEVSSPVRTMQADEITPSPSCDWEYDVGYITADMIRKRLPAWKEDGAVLVCGPDPMVRSVVSILDQFGYDPKRIFVF